MIVATLKIELPRQKRGKMLGVLKPLREPTQAEPGCVSCHVYQDLNDESLIVLEEAWSKR